MFKIKHPFCDKYLAFKYDSRYYASSRRVWYFNDERTWGSVQNGFNFAGGTGTAWELGFARAQGKDVIVLCTDIKAKQSLMIINSGRVVMPYEQYKEAWKIYNGLIYLNDCYIHPDLQDQS